MSTPEQASENSEPAPSVSVAVEVKGYSPNCAPAQEATLASNQINAILDCLRHQRQFETYGARL